MTTIGYNHCNNVAMNNNYPHNQQAYLNVDLSLVKNEPVDSIDYHQSVQTYQYVQQQISPQLPPTPPSPSSSNHSNDIHVEQQINQNNQINSSPLTNQQATSQMIIKTASQLNDQFNNHQINNSLNNQIKGQQAAYLPAARSKHLLEFEQPHNQQPLITKYRKNKSLHNGVKPYGLPSADQSATRTKSHSTSRRNERERKRVKNVNEGFKKLQDHIPNNEKKMSKVETLRSAVRYIRQLKELLNGPASSTDYLFDMIQKNVSSSLQQAIKKESSNSIDQTEHDQTSSSSLDYFDLAELLFNDDSVA